MIREITEFIENQAGLTRDTDLFAGHRPQDAANNCDVVMETAGGMVFFDLPERADVVIQVLSRGETYLVARVRAWAIYDAIFRDYTLTGSAGWTLPVMVVWGEWVWGDGFIWGEGRYEAMVIEPVSPPQYIGQDKKLRFEFSTNYIFRTKRL